LKEEDERLSEKQEEVSVARIHCSEVELLEVFCDCALRVKRE